jgi:two-component system osmolarity sensor histidine kinase EnvZ
VQTLRALEFEPRAVQAAQQIASLVNLSRAALQPGRRHQPRGAGQDHGSRRSRCALAPREPGDRWEPFEVDRFTRRVAASCAPARARHHRRQRRSTAAGPVGRLHDRADRYWLQADASRVAPAGSTWFVWIGIALLATLIGSAASPADQPAAASSCRSPPAASAKATSTRAWTRTR